MKIDARPPGGQSSKLFCKRHNKNIERRSLLAPLLFPFSLNTLSLLPDFAATLGPNKLRAKAQGNLVVSVLGLVVDVIGGGRVRLIYFGHKVLISVCGITKAYWLSYH